MPKIETLKHAVPQETRDEHGRLLAADGYPEGGLGTANDAVAVSKLCPSKIYQMVESGELDSRRFGRAVRIPWSAIREMFLDDK